MTTKIVITFQVQKIFQFQFLQSFHAPKDMIKLGKTKVCSYLGGLLGLG